MSIRLVTDKENVDYQAVADILDHFGLSHFDAATEEKIFKNSYATAFIYDGDQVVGCARAISDGVCQAAIYNVALLEGDQGQQLGRKLIDSLLEQVKGWSPYGQGTGKCTEDRTFSGEAGVCDKGALSGA